MVIFANNRINLVQHDAAINRPHLFANNWINLALKNVAKDMITKQNVEKIVEQPVVPKVVSKKRNMNSQYFRDMITLDKHMKSSYTKDEVTGKHKKSSYVKEFVTD